VELWLCAERVGFRWRVCDDCVGGFGCECVAGFGFSGCEHAMQGSSIPLLVGPGASLLVVGCSFTSSACAIALAPSSVAAVHASTFDGCKIGESVKRNLVLFIGGWGLCLWGFGSVVMRVLMFKRAKQALLHASDQHHASPNARSRTAKLRHFHRQFTWAPVINWKRMCRMRP